MKNGFWPDTSSPEGARTAARQGVWAAGFVAFVTTAASAYSYFGSEILNINLWGLVDAAIFAAIAIGIWRYSRVAATAGLALYILERVWMFQANGRMPGILTLLLVLMFVNGIRGAIAHHELPAENEDDGPISPE